ncbi:MAG: ABC transporter transmembrane domain-containing protein [Firmicutes bacterium]|nr:ABC transporter transmembrane domain-containing protein [Bacillota bacterium]
MPFHKGKEKKDKKGKNKNKKPRRLPGRLPPEVLTLLEKQGLATEEFILGVTGDMDNEGNYRAAWLAFDEKGLYIAFGEERTEFKRKLREFGKKKPETTYTLGQLQTIPLGDIEKLRVERYITTGRLISTEGGEDIALARFSIGLCKKFQQLCDCVNALHDGKDMKPFLADTDETQYCEKCGEKFPDARKVCPKCGKKDSTVKRLFGFFGGYKWQIAVILLFLLASTLLTVVYPKVGTQMLFDDVLGNTVDTPAQKLAALGWLVLLIGGIRLLNILLTMAYEWAMASITPQVVYDIKKKIFSAMQNLSVGFFSGKQTGQLMERVTRDANNIYWFFIDAMPHVIRSFVQLGGGLTMMFLLSWKLSLAVLCVATPLMVIISSFSKVYRRLHHREWASNARLTSMVSDNINGQRVIKAFSQEDRELARFGGVSGGLRDAEMNVARMESSLFPLLTGVVTVLSTGVLLMGGFQVLDGSMTPGGLLSFVVYLVLVQSPLDFLSWVFNWWARCKDSAHRVFEIVDAEPDIKEIESPVQLERLHGDVELRELEFEYEPARPIIKRVNLKVEAGRMLGIVGKTGAGKTTIANLISRLYDTKAGAILLDGVDVKDLPLALLRKNIGLVSQDIYLFTGSVMDNIRYAKPEASLSEVMAAAKAAAAHDFIMKLPDAYETRVGNGGQDLSGGERQRVSIARAILQNPKILILDEATAAMDTATERSIQESLSELKTGRTTIAIAHRLSTLRDADVLAVIEDGELKEFGSFNELIKQKGAFFELYQVQQKALATMGSIEDRLDEPKKEKEEE